MQQIILVGRVRVKKGDARPSNQTVGALVIQGTSTSVTTTA